MANPQDAIEYKILLEATKAVQDLEKLTASATTVDEKMVLTAAAVTDFGTKLGISLPVAEGLFKRVEQAALQLQATMAKLSASGGTMALGPLGQGLMNVNPIFPPVTTGAAGDTAAQAQVSAEMWKGVHIQIQQAEQEMAKFDALVKQANISMERAAAAAAGIPPPIKTASDNMASLRAFLQTTSGKGILQTFLGDYSAAGGPVAQITAIKTAMMSLKAETGASLSQIGTLFKSTFTDVPTGQIDKAIKELNQSLGNTPAQADKAVRSIDAMRIALGAIVAMVVFQVIQAFQQFFSMAIKNAYDLEGALYNVANAERIMSQQGIEITPKDMKEMIDNLQRLVPLMSQIDATKAISSLTLFTKDLGYTKDQINSLAESVGVLYVRNKAMGLSFEQVLSQVQTGLLTGRAQGIRDLGVSISEAAIKQEALRMGLVKTESEFSNLTGDVETQIKAQAMLSIIVRSTAEEQKNLGNYLDTSAAKTDRLKASFSNFSTMIGQLVLPGLGLLSSMLNTVLDMWMYRIKAVEALVSEYSARIAAALYVADNVAKGNIKNIDQMKEAYQRMLESGRSAAMGVFDEVQKLDGMQDTATGSAEKLTQSLVDMSKVDLSSLENSLQGIKDRISDLNRDFSLKNENYIQDQNIKMARMQQDYQASVQQTIQDFNNRRADSEAQYRNQQLDAEAKYQEQLRELRARYLFDLEDALRARDARQVLRLQAQYRMDKSNLENNFKIESESRARQHAEEMAQLRRNEQQKLAEMAKAEAIKEARAQEDFARDQAMRQQEYENQLSDLKRSWDERLSEEANKLAEEYGLDEKGAAAIKTLLEKYYGKGGVFDGLYTGSLNSLKAKGSAMLAEMANIIMQYQALASSIGGMFVGTMPGNEPYRGGGGTYNGTTPSTGGGGSTSWGGSENATTGNRRAKGGIDFATKPTSLTFGEAGPEMAITLPLGKSLADVPNNMPAPAGAQSLGGIIQLMIDLNPDLEARIVDNTLKEAAQITTNVYRRRS